MATHPKHPPCPECGKALYKAPLGGKAPKKGDPWKYCRTKGCKGPLGAEKPLPRPEDMHGAADGFGGSDYPDAIPPGPLEPKAAPEHPAVKQARVRIREVLFQVIPGKYDASTVGITLALVSQETGNHGAANVLIAEYQLTEKYGILPVK